MEEQKARNIKYSMDHPVLYELYYQPPDFPWSLAFSLPPHPHGVFSYHKLSLWSAVHCESETDKEQEKRSARGNVGRIPSPYGKF